MTCGIYSIRNNENGKMYIGQSVNIEKRFNNHISNLNNGNHPNNYLQRAWDKYGSDAFDFKMLLLCFEDELDVEEQKFIKLYGTYKNGYNLTWGGDFNPSKHPEIAKKISEALKGENHFMYGKHPSEETRKKMSESRKGRTLSEETRKKISEALKGKNCGENHPFYGKTFSEETRKKISESKKGRNNPNYGKHLSDKHKKKISEALKGENHYMYGKHLSDEHKKKISEAKKGGKLSNETKKKLSEAHNTSGYFRVSKHTVKNCKQGFTWRYSYYENGKQKNISSVDIKELEKKVKEKGLEWHIIGGGI